MVSPLYLISDGGGLRASNKLITTIQSALKGAKGAISHIQLREQLRSHPCSDADLLRLAEQLKPICKQYQAKLIINKRVDLALAVGADGVHLGIDSIGYKEARYLLGEKAEIGFSAHSVQEAEKALSQGFDYVFLSPIFKPYSKKNYSPRVLGVNALSQLCKRNKADIFALGGIDCTNIKDCKLAGARGVALISSILLAEDPGRMAREMALMWDAV